MEWLKLRPADTEHKGLNWPLLLCCLRRLQLHSSSSSVSCLTLILSFFSVVFSQSPLHLHLSWLPLFSWFCTFLLPPLCCHIPSFSFLTYCTLSLKLHPFTPLSIISLFLCLFILYLPSWSQFGFFHFLCTHLKPSIFVTLSISLFSFIFSSPLYSISFSVCFWLPSLSHLSPSFILSLFSPPFLSLSIPLFLSVICSHALAQSFYPSVFPLSLLSPRIPLRPFTLSFIFSSFLLFRPSSFLLHLFWTSSPSSSSDSPCSVFPALSYMSVSFLTYQSVSLLVTWICI